MAYCRLSAPKAVPPIGHPRSASHLFVQQCRHNVFYGGDGEWLFDSQMKAAIVFAAMTGSYRCRCTDLVAEMSALERNARVLEYSLAYDGDCLFVSQICQ